ncbi:lysophospholipid acyltransferase LPCAT4 isoform X2 [Arapaima gigas]
MESNNNGPHPFVYELHLSRGQKIQGLLLGVVLFPLRVALAALLFLVMWPVAKLRLAGLSPEERAQPVRGWRRWLLHPIVLLLSRAIFFSLGFVWVKVKGHQAGRKEAPLLAVAPHSSFLDMLILCVTGLPTVVSRSENTSLPVIGALLEFNQSLLVSRKDPESRRRCAAQLSERLQSNDRWPQVLLFPEGTTTNGQALIKFKHGGFAPGVPVQPVLLHYPNKLDTVRWTWKGTSWVEALWYTTSQLYTNITVEFLPVYTPSADEKTNPTLYADNVQKLMARRLGVPATDYVMEGKLPVWKLGCLSLPVEPPARDALTLLQSAGASDVDILLRRMIDRCHPGQEASIGAEELSSMLQLKDTKTAVDICRLYSKDEQVDLRQLVLSVAAVSGVWNLDSLIHTSFNLFDRGNKGSLTEKEMSDLLTALVGFSQRNISALYSEVANGQQPTQEDLETLLTEHPSYQRLTADYLNTCRTKRLSANAKMGSHTSDNGAAVQHKKDN